MTRVKINDKVCDFDLCFKKKKGKGKLHSSAEIFTAVIWVTDCKNNEIKTVCSVSYVLFKPHGKGGNRKCI